MNRIGRLPHKAKQIAKFTFIDAPYLMELRPEDTVPMRTWFYRDGNIIIEESLESTLNYLEDIWQKEGPFDGILGFSMGGSVASIMASLPDRYPGLKFVIVGGAPDVPSHLLDSDKHSKIPKTIHSLHLIGLADNAVPPFVSQNLSARFYNPTVIEHEQGHCIPTRAAQLDRYVEFIRQFVIEGKNMANEREQAPEGSFQNPTEAHIIDSVEVCNLQNEEIEVLSSIYSSSEFKIIGDLPQKPYDPTIRCLAYLNPTSGVTGIPQKWIGNLAIQFTLRGSYPLKSNEVPIIEITSGSLSLLDFSTAHRRSLLHAVRQVAQDICQHEGETCLMQCIQAGNDWLSDGGRILQDFPVDMVESNDEKLEPVETGSDVVVPDIDEEIENEWIRQATIEAGHAAALAKARGLHETEIISCLNSEENIIASASARGLWNYTVGLVGKPSAGKVPAYASMIIFLIEYLLQRSHEGIT